MHALLSLISELYEHFYGVSRESLAYTGRGAGVVMCEQLVWDRGVYLRARGGVEQHGARGDVFDARDLLEL